MLVALASPEELEVLAVTTVAGNVPVELTTKNALKALELARRTDVQVYRGAAAPLVRPLVTAEQVHGRTGFDGYDLPEPTMAPAEGFAPDAIVELVMSRPAKTVTMCCLAPLTNLALAMAREPRLAGHLEAIVLMGGAFSEGGNITRPRSSTSTSIPRRRTGYSAAARRSPCFRWTARTRRGRPTRD